MEKTRVFAGQKRQRGLSQKTPKSFDDSEKLNMVFAKKPFLNLQYVHPTKFKTFKQVINLEKNQTVPLGVPTYWSIEAAPSTLPQMKYCDITGLEAPYTDPQTSLRYHNVDTYKFIKTLQQRHIQDYLELRKAGPDLRS